MNNHIYQRKVKQKQRTKAIDELCSMLNEFLDNKELVAIEKYNNHTLRIKTVSWNDILFNLNTGKRTAIDLVELKDVPVDLEHIAKHSALITTDAEEGQIK